MTAMIVNTAQDRNRKVAAGQRMQVMVNVQAEILDPEAARRKANRWLLDNVGNLLGAEGPELLLGTHLLWRYDVVLGVPDMETSGTGHLHRLGQIRLDAITGEVQDAAELILELQANAASAVD